MARLKITTDDWLSELQRLSDRSDEGFTAYEWAEKMDVERDCALRRLKMAHRAGWLRVGRRRVTSLDGRQALVPVYRIVRPKKGTVRPKKGTVKPKAG